MRRIGALSPMREDDPGSVARHGSGSPTVLLISGTDTASDLWHAADQKDPTVYEDIQKTTRACAYDRPGALHLDQTFSRSVCPSRAVLKTESTTSSNGFKSLTAPFDLKSNIQVLQCGSFL
jgi:hypothetical protein